MKHKKAPKAHVSRILVAVLVGVIAVPTAMTGLFQSIDDDGINVFTQSINMRQKAYNDAGRVRNIRRNYWRAVDVYNELIRLDYEGDLIPPDINDVDSIEYYLNPENFTGAEISVHASAPESDIQHEYNMLPGRWRSLLDGYIDSRFCSPVLSTYVVHGYDTNLFDLCVRLLDDRIASIKPNLLERSAYLRGFNSLGIAPIRNLRNRLQVLEESLIYEGGTSTRPRTHSGSRPRLDYSQYRN